MTRELLLLRSGAAEFGINLDDGELELFSRFAAELAKWNRKINLTAITGPDDVVLKHFLDSLTVAAKVALAGRVLDIGSGAGFPGIPLQIVRPDLEIVSVDAVEKKILFQRHAARILGLANFRAVHARGETLQGTYRSNFDIILSRAFTDLLAFVKMVHPLLAAGGTIVAMKGSEGRNEVATSEHALEELGLSVEEVHEFGLPCCGDRRSIITLKRKQVVIN